MLTDRETSASSPFALQTDRQQKLGAEPQNSDQDKEGEEFGRQTQDWWRIEDEGIERGGEDLLFRRSTLNAQASAEVRSRIKDAPSTGQSTGSSELRSLSCRSRE